MTWLRWTLCALAALTLLLAGCPTTPPYVVDDDDASGDDDTGDDATGDDDTGDDDDSVPEIIEGYVSMTFSENAVMGVSAVLTGTFFEIIEDGVPGVEYGFPDVIDECVLTLYDDDEAHSGTPAIWAYESAGVLSVVGGDIDVSVTPTVSGDTVVYQQTLDPGALDVATRYDVSATGEDFAAFDAPAAIEMPEPIHITGPALELPFEADGDLEVTWSGGDVGSLLAYISSTDSSVEPYQHGFLICEVTGDGHFTMPGDLIDQLPSGYATLVLTQSRSSYVDVEGRWIALTGNVNSSVTGTVL